MNFKLLAIIIFTCNFIIGLIETFLDMKQLKKPLPKSVNGIFEDDEYNKFKLYTKDRLKMKIINLCCNYLVMMIILIFNVFALIFNKINNDYLFLLIYLLFSLLLSVGFEYINTMKIEEKYGFNNTTIKRFISDQIIGFIISYGLLAGLITICMLYDVIPTYFPFIITGVLIIFLIIINVLSPLFLRIYNKFTPLEGPLREKLEALVRSYNYQVKDISICDASKRTTKLNAFCAGSGKFKRIGIYDNLLEKVSEDEIIAIFAHELAHAKHKDTLKNILFTSILAYIIVLCLSFMYKSSFFIDFKANSNSFAFLIVVAFEYFIGLLSKVLSPLQSYLSRLMEYSADRFACKSGYGKELASGLIKLCKENLANLNPSKLDIFLNYSHPPIYDRLKAIELHTNKNTSK